MTTFLKIMVPCDKAKFSNWFRSRQHLVHSASRLSTSHRFPSPHAEWNGLVFSAISPLNCHFKPCIERVCQVVPFLNLGVERSLARPKRDWKPCPKSNCHLHWFTSSHCKKHQQNKFMNRNDRTSYKRYCNFSNF